MFSKSMDEANGRGEWTSLQPDVAVPPGAAVRDLAGKVIIPGLVDVHAHLHYGAGDILPASEWRYRTNLDFGVTTVHDPSASTDLVFTQAERVEAGLMPGPPREAASAARVLICFDSELIMLMSRPCCFWEAPSANGAASARP